MSKNRRFKGFFNWIEFLSKPKRALVALMVCSFAIGVLTMPKVSYMGNVLGSRVPANVATNLDQTGPSMVVSGFEKVVTEKLKVTNESTRFFLLNLFLVVIHMVLAFVLFRITSFYTNRTWMRIGFVAACLYGTYLWNYLRAHNGEALQVLLFSMSYLFFLQFKAAFMPSKKGAPLKNNAMKPLALAWLSILCLILTKISYVVLAPIFAFAVLYLGHFHGENFKKKTGQKFALQSVIFPAIVMFAIACTLNYFQTGHAFNTGMTQIREGFHALSNSVWVGLGGFFFSPQWSIFVHFPLLILAIFGARTFYKKFKVEATYLAATFVIFMVMMAKMPNWKGEYGYGPRYVIFFLPILALPALFVMEKLIQNRRDNLHKAALGFFALVMAASFWAQLQVNRLDFFAYYSIRPDMTQTKNADVRKYFTETNFAKINWDYLQAKNNLDQLPVMRALASEMKPSAYRAYKTKVETVLARGNYYWCN
ncbi:hypothetical protein K2X30_02355 [bacterium]|nr:hypothetical protein [bacterium]